MSRLDELLWVTSLWAIGATDLAVLLLAAGIGEQLGHRARARRGAEGGPQLGTVQAAILGLLGLLLAFTYAQAANRYDARKQLMIRETNAIGTVWLRTTFLPEPERTKLREMLKQYVDLRIVSEEGRANPERQRARVAASEALHGPIWKATTAALRKRVPTILDGLLVGSVNEMIDLHTSRLASYRDRVPGEVLLLLALVSALALLLTGYGFGVVGQRGFALIVVVAVVIAVVTFTIVDLDRSHRGLIRVSQESMLHLRDTLQASR